MEVKGTGADVFVNVHGPLPLTKKVTPLGNTAETVYLSGSCFSAQANQQIGFELYIAGQLAMRSVIFANNANQHLATVPVMVDCKIPFVVDHNGNIQPVEFEIRAMEGTSTDQNDVFNLMIMA